MSFLRNIQKSFRRFLNVKSVRLDGILLSTDLKDVSPIVRDGIFKGTYEEPERILIRSSLAAGDRVLEIGAGIGCVSLICARICGAENVLSYEANPGMARVIQANYALNGLKPNLRSKAISDQGREVTFFIADNIISSGLTERGAGRSHTLPADPFAEVIAEWKPTIIVMDVEGAETTLLPACDLSGVSKMIVELHPHIVGPEKIDHLKKQLRAVGFEEARSVHHSSLFARRTAGA